jgi:hypothetical protein
MSQFDEVFMTVPFSISALEKSKIDDKPMSVSQVRNGKAHISQVKIPIKLYFSLMNFVIYFEFQFPIIFPKVILSYVQ